MTPSALEADPALASSIACRRMGDGDIEGAVALLTRGFPTRSAAYWRRGLDRLRTRDVPEPHPRYGYVMTEHGRLVGILLLIFSRARDGRIMANVSSWYVDPGFRGFSSVLLAFAFRMKNVVLFNISPTPGTVETISAQGFRLYCAGTFHALPALARPVRGASLHVIEPDDGPQATALERLAAQGCHSLEIAHRGLVHEFAFLPRRFSRDRLPCAQLVHCSDLDAFVRFAGPLGRRLARHGLPSVMLDANGPIAGLKGRYLPGRRVKYFRGDAPPALNELGETELVLFGP